MYMMSINHITSLQAPSLFTLPLLTHYTYFIVLLSLLVSKSTFIGVSQCIPTVSILYFVLFNPFTEFHRVVPQSQTCSIYEFVYNHACFCVYIYLLDLSFTYERKYVAFVFLNLTYFI
jgi:hypothetical protein